MSDSGSVLGLRDAAKAAERTRAEYLPKASTMTRLADAMHRLDRLTEAMEKAADEGERQLALIRGRL